MNLTELSRDPLIEVGLRLRPQDLINYCLTNRADLLPICRNRVFQVAYLKQYGVLGLSLPNGTFFDLLEWMGRFDWDLVPGASLDQKGRYITETIEMLGRFNPNDIALIQYGGGSLQYEVYPGVTSVVERAVRTASPTFLQQVLDALVPLIRNQPVFQDSLGEPFLVAVRLGQPWIPVANTLLHYYDARNDFVLHSGYYADAVRTGDLPLVQALEPIFPPDEEGFWIALENNQPETATWIRNRLLAQGTDPIRRIDPYTQRDALYEEYEYAISGGDLAYVKRLAQYGPPTQDHVQWALEQGQPQIEAFLQERL